MARVANNLENLRQLLAELYVSANLGSADHDVSDEEWDRIHSTVLDAAEGRQFEPLRSPFPRPSANIDYSVLADDAKRRYPKILRSRVE